MLKVIFLIVIVGCALQNTYAQFGKLFEPKTLRLDYFHCGNHAGEQFYFSELKQEPYWGGSQTNLIDNRGYGSYLVEMRSAATNEIIYSRGYTTLFSEWQATPEAKTTSYCYPESVIMPFPKDKVIVSIHSKEKGEYKKKFEYQVDPDSYQIKKEKGNLPVFDILTSGNPATKVDIVLLAEGYTEGQQELFKADCRRFMADMFGYAPFSTNRNKFNIKGVWASSIQEGPDVPGDSIWHNTHLNSSYYTFGSERYLMVNDYQGVCDMAANAPYDYIYILANTTKYGGGAIYNYYGISAAHHDEERGKIYIHEFGHLFAGLGDEYEGGADYSDYYPEGLEPWEPNLTTLVNFGKKWKNMLPEGTPIPTPKVAANDQKLGVYEGGGYLSKGVYRPWINCIMNNFHTINIFCPVCHKALQQTIDFQCK